MRVLALVLGFANAIHAYHLQRGQLNSLLHRKLQHQPSQQQLIDADGFEYGRRFKANPRDIGAKQSKKRIFNNKEVKQATSRTTQLEYETPLEELFEDMKVPRRIRSGKSGKSSKFKSGSDRQWWNIDQSGTHWVSALTKPSSKSSKHSSKISGPGVNWASGHSWSSSSKSSKTTNKSGKSNDGWNCEQASWSSYQSKSAWSKSGKSTSQSKHIRSSSSKASKTSKTDSKRGKNNYGWNSESVEGSTQASWLTTYQSKSAKSKPGKSTSHSKPVVSLSMNLYQIFDPNTSPSKSNKKPPHVHVSYETKVLSPPSMSPTSSPALVWEMPLAVTPRNPTTPYPDENSWASEKEVQCQDSRSIESSIFTYYYTVETRANSNDFITGLEHAFLSYAASQLLDCSHLMSEQVRALSTGDYFQRDTIGVSSLPKDKIFDTCTPAHAEAGFCYVVIGSVTLMYASGYHKRHESTVLDAAESFLDSLNSTKIDSNIIAVSYIGTTFHMKMEPEYTMKAPEASSIDIFFPSENANHGSWKNSILTAAYITGAIGIFALAFAGVSRYQMNTRKDGEVLGIDSRNNGSISPTSTQDTDVSHSYDMDLIAVSPSASNDRYDKIVWSGKSQMLPYYVSPDDEKVKVKKYGHGDDEFNGWSLGGSPNLEEQARVHCIGSL